MRSQCDLDAFSTPAVPVRLEMATCSHFHSAYARQSGNVSIRFRVFRFKSELSIPMQPEVFGEALRKRACTAADREWPTSSAPQLLLFKSNQCFWSTAAKAPFKFVIFLIYKSPAFATNCENLKRLLDVRLELCDRTEFQV